MTVASAVAAPATTAAIQHRPLTYPWGSATVRQGSTTVVCGVDAQVVTLSSIPAITHSAASAHTQGRRWCRLKTEDVLSFAVQVAPGTTARDADSSELMVMAGKLRTLAARSRLLEGREEDGRKEEQQGENQKEQNDNKEDALLALAIGSCAKCHCSGAVASKVQCTCPQRRNSGEDTADYSDDTEADPSTDEKTSDEPLAYWIFHVSLTFLALRPSPIMRGDGPPRTIAGDDEALAAAWTAVVEALSTLRLPAAVWDARRGCVVCSPDLARSRPLPLRRTSVAVLGSGSGGGKGKGKGKGKEANEEAEESLLKRLNDAMTAKTASGVDNSHGQAGLVTSATLRDGSGSDALLATYIDG